MKIVVIGGTGLIGSEVVAKLKQKGHEALAAAPNTGVNTITGEGLARACWRSSRRAGRRRLKVVTRGQGPSTYSRSMAEGRIVIDMNAISAVHSAEADRIGTGGGRLSHRRPQLAMTFAEP